MLKITKTPKCYVGGKFIRSESGQVAPLLDPDGNFLANIPLCSRKDLRNAVEAAAKASPAWARRSPYNRAQILYRLAEMLEARSTELTEAVALAGAPRASADREVRAAIERTVHFAGWADKFEQVLGTVNPVSSAHFNFTVSEPVGITGILCPENAPLLGLLTLGLPALTAGNTVVALASRAAPHPAILLGEMLATSDLPGGALNLLTGNRADLLPTFATHQHLRAIVACVGTPDATSLEQGASQSVKRVKIHPLETDWFSASHDSPYPIRDLTEAKTVWHPVDA